MNEETITLKWGTLKGWNVNEGSAAIPLLQRYHELGVSMSCAAQKDTEEQKKILCDMVSLPGMRVYLDWGDKYVSKDQAIEYIDKYGNHS